MSIIIITMKSPQHAIPKGITDFFFVFLLQTFHTYGVNDTSE